jgi:hypothetical protein
MRTQTRALVAAVLAAFLASPPASLVSATLSGTVQGLVTLSGRPLSGMDLALVDLNSGAVHRARSGGTGAYQLQVAPGDYVITSGGGQAGLTVGRGPTHVAVVAGQVAIADLDLVALPVALANANAGTRVASLQTPQEVPLAAPATEPPAPEAAAATTIQHEPIGCFIAGQFPLVDAGIQPAASVARARVYFKSALSNDWFFVEMTTQEGQFFGKLPRPRVEASPITYYIQATTTEFGEAQTGEIQGNVVADARECPDKKIAAIGPPGPVQVFSAATGASISPAGFAAGGLALTAGTIALLAGAAAVGIGTAIVVNNPTPTPTATPTATPLASPTPTDQPRPTPTPSPTPTPIRSPPPGTPIR